MRNAILHSKAALLPWSALYMKWPHASPLYLRTEHSFHIIKNVDIIKQALKYTSLSKPRVCYLLGPTDLGFDNSQYHTQPHAINVAYYAEVKKHFHAGKCYVWKNKQDWLLFFFTKLLYIMVMVAINSVQLLCRRTWQTLQVYHRQR